jgi:hypothetical protein
LVFAQQNKQDNHLHEHTKNKHYLQKHANNNIAIMNFKSMQRKTPLFSFSSVYLYNNIFEYVETTIKSILLMVFS